MNDQGYSKKVFRNTQSRNRKPDYSANLRAWDKAEIQQLNEFIKSDPANAVALVPISVGSNLNHNNGRFLAMLNLLKDLGFKSIIVLVADVLQRFGRLIKYLHILLKDVIDKFNSKGDFNPSEEQIDAAMDKVVKKELQKLVIGTRDEGFNWILSNINSLEEVFGRGNYTMLRWDIGRIRTVDNPKHASNDVQSFPEAFSFVEQLKQFEQWCVEKPEYAKAVDESTQQFLSRIEQREAKAEAESNFSRLLNKYRKQYSDEYIREETAAMLAFHNNDPRPLPVAYPGGANPALIQAVTDCIDLKPGQIYPFILGDVGKDPGMGLDVRIREVTTSIDDDEDTELNNLSDKGKSVSPGAGESAKAPSLLPAVGNGSTPQPVVTNPGLVHGTIFGPNANGSVFDRVAAIVAQNNMLLQEALKHDQHIVISAHH